MTLWRLTLSKKPGQPNFGIITTAIYVRKCGSVAQGVLRGMKNLHQSTA